MTIYIKGGTVSTFNRLYMDNLFVHIKEEDASLLFSKEKHISVVMKELKEDLNKEKNRVKDENGLYVGLCFLYYHYHKTTYNHFGEEKKLEDSDEVRLAWLGHWEFSTDYTYLMPRFYSVNDKGEHNNRIYMEHKSNVSFEPLDCSVMEAKKILKKAKKMSNV